jgi:hypothetical protein
MATFAELLSDTYLITNRPDLVNETKLAVKAATLKAHQSDFYPKDLFEVGISWDTPAFIQSIEYRTLIPRWRAFKYLRKYAGNTPGEFIKLLTPDQTLDAYSFNKENICYLAGEMLEVRSSTQDDYMILACYINPILDENSYSSWIALDHPYAIVFEAARMIYKQIGWAEEAQTMRQEVGEQYQILKQEVVAYGE